MVLSDPKRRKTLLVDVFSNFFIFVKKNGLFYLYCFFSKYCSTKTRGTPELIRMMKPTGVISAELHKQLLKDVCILSEEQAVGLGKHLVHGLL